MEAATPASPPPGFEDLYSAERDPEVEDYYDRDYHYHGESVSLNLSYENSLNSTINDYINEG